MAAKANATEPTTMRQHTVLLLLASAFALSPMSARAATHGQFSVGVQVVSSAPADHALLASVPAPANAVLMRATRNVRDHAFSGRSEEHTSELQSLMRISYAVFCLKKKT